jgi:glutathione S-transferase
MPDFTIVLGNKRYSSWSLRGWLLLKQTGADFGEIVIPLDQPQTKRDILHHNPAGKVPVLKSGDAVVWDSLAIAEYLHERFPDAGIWPADSGARAMARSISAEMHAGFAALRTHLPMDVCTQNPARGQRALADPQVAADVNRIVAIWNDCREWYGSGGDFLFGTWSAADAMYAPVATRFTTYAVPLQGAATAYREAVMTSPAMAEWIAAAQAETWVIDQG